MYCFLKYFIILILFIKKKKLALPHSMWDISSLIRN